MKEEWRDIPTWEGMYKISNLGRCLSVRTGKLKATPPNNYGYARVACYCKNRKQKLFIHKLVAMLFVDGYFDGVVVNHIDGDKTNNICTNLEWCTHSENTQHAFKHHLKIGKRQNRPMLFVPQDGDPSLQSFETIVEGAKTLGVDEKRIHHLLKTNNGFVKELNGYVIVACLTTNSDECKSVGCK